MSREGEIGAATVSTNRFQHNVAAAAMTRGGDMLDSFDKSASLPLSGLDRTVGAASVFVILS